MRQRSDPPLVRQRKLLSGNAVPPLTSAAPFELGCLELIEVVTG